MAVFKAYGETRGVVAKENGGNQNRRNNVCTYIRQHNV